MSVFTHRLADRGSRKENTVVLKRYFPLFLGGLSLEFCLKWMKIIILLI